MHTMRESVLRSILRDRDGRGSSYSGSLKVLVFKKMEKDSWEAHTSSKTIPADSSC